VPVPLVGDGKAVVLTQERGVSGLEVAVEQPPRWLEAAALRIKERGAAGRDRVDEGGGAGIDGEARGAGREVRAQERQHDVGNHEQHQGDLQQRGRGAEQPAGRLPQRLRRHLVRNGAAAPSRAPTG